ncbi:alpha/beta fold hydrolase [Henriciella litoralis]|uniref:alpha/beta fold hydrolase n=1 Tax=Henriciella litoralis TaxID=568102 RepID=UPI002D21951E|nr:alpha/beta hydrolase [Henriciella litoralis]
MTEASDGDMAAIEFGNKDFDLAGVWLHANGFNAMTYQSLLAPLGERRRVAALDMRGHGRTTLTADPKSLKSWKVYRDDVIDFLEKRAARPVVLGGHSLGGCVSMLVAGKRPDLVNALILVDPVVFSKRFYFNMHTMPLTSLVSQNTRMARRARQRRAEFGGPKEAFEAYKGKGAFKTWREPFLEDYLRDGLHRIDENAPRSKKQTWRLTCEPAWEAATFAGQRNRPWKALRKIRDNNIPVVIFRPQIGAVLTDAVTKRMLKVYPQIVLKERPNATHFHPMEVPFEVRDELSRTLTHMVDGYSLSEDSLMRRSLHGNH